MSERGVQTELSRLVQRKESDGRELSCPGTNPQSRVSVRKPTSQQPTRAVSPLPGALQVWQNNLTHPIKFMLICFLLVLKSYLKKIIIVALLLNKSY